MYMNTIKYKKNSQRYLFIIGIAGARYYCNSEVRYIRAASAT